MSIVSENYDFCHGFRYPSGNHVFWDSIFDNILMSQRFWQVLHWIFLPLWVLGAALNMATIHGGFLTNYLSDLVFPPDFYIIMRGLHNHKIPRNLAWFAQTPERSFFGIWIVGVVSEVCQYYWPRGIFRGTFDPWDIASYTVGLVVCYLLDKRK